MVVCMERKASTVTTTVVLPVIVKKKLQFLAHETRISQSEYIREALDDLLVKYGTVFKGSQFDESVKSRKKTGKTQ